MRFGLFDHISLPLVARSTISTLPMANPTILGPHLDVFVVRMGFHILSRGHRWQIAISGVHFVLQLLGRFQ